MPCVHCVGRFVLQSGVCGDGAVGWHGREAILFSGSYVEGVESKPIVGRSKRSY